MESDRLIEWILEQQLPFDSLYYYGSDRPIHISYGLQHKRDLWAFTPKGVPTKKGLAYLDEWLKKYNQDLRKGHLNGWMLELLNQVV